MRLFGRARSVFALFVLAGFVRNAQPIRVYLAGDSTLAQKVAEKRPETGWGEALQQYFRPDDVEIVNRAKNGRSTRTFINEGLWQAIVDSLRAGDWVFIEFGHNDAATNRPDRYTPPRDYRANLLRFVADVRAKGGSPVLLTPVQRRRFNEQGTLVDGHGEYPEIVRAVASEQQVPLIDMHVLSTRVLSTLGADSSRRLFLHLQPGENVNYPSGVIDNTHFSPAGAELMACLAVEGMSEMRLELLSRLARDSARAVARRLEPTGCRAVALLAR